MSIYAKLHEVRIRIGFKFSSSTLLVTQCIRARQLGTALQDSNPHTHIWPMATRIRICHIMTYLQFCTPSSEYPFPFPLALWALWAEVCEIALVVFAELFIRRLVHEPVELRRRRQLHLDHPAISLRGRIH